MIEKALSCATVSYCLTRVGLFWLQIFTLCHYVWDGLYSINRDLKMVR